MNYRQIKRDLMRMERGLPPLPQFVTFTDRNGKRQTLDYNSLFYLLGKQIAFCKYFIYDEDKFADEQAIDYSKLDHAGLLEVMERNKQGRNVPRPMGDIFIDDYELEQILQKMPVCPRRGAERNAHNELVDLLRLALLGYVRDENDVCHHLCGLEFTTEGMDLETYNEIIDEYQDDKQRLIQRMEIWKQIRTDKQLQMRKETEEQ